ncbi:hypothetical protein [Desulfogranum japonicum]|uniref:hypothetical protein n=1 Tax=Desulfogranum japonicum TaxID=231447 RepID=UPI000687B317|nr:hypothetical protein [Desulfogranum japonicum]
MIQKQLWFKTDLFDIEPEEDQETNPLCFGRQLANWVKIRLDEESVGRAEIIPEDWGWCVVVQRKPYLLWVGCVSVHDYEKSASNDRLPQGQDIVWTCIVAAEPSFLRRLLGADTKVAVESLYKKLKQILVAEPAIVFVPQP